MGAIVSSFNSVGAAVYTESLFKTSGENFLEQQFWLYLYGMCVAAGVHVVSAQSISPGLAFSALSGVSTRVQVLLVAALVFGSVGGLVVAAILKRLDNVVKEYSSATANMFTAVLCSFLFPEKFSFTIYIVFAMLLLFAGIYLYERKKGGKSGDGDRDEEHSKNITGNGNTKHSDIDNGNNCKIDNMGEGE